MPRRKQRTPELREHLLNAALDTLADSGVAGFTARRVSTAASTSVPALYELFGDRGGLVREMFFAGFRRLGVAMGQVAESDDPEADLESTALALRDFARENPVLAQLMFSRPFVDFEPGPEEAAAGAVVRDAIVGRVRRGVESGRLVGDPTDIAHVLLAVAQGLMTQEAGGWLGSRPDADRRWALAARAVLDGFSE